MGTETGVARVEKIWKISLGETQPESYNEMDPTFIQPLKLLLVVKKVVVSRKMTKRKIFSKVFWRFVK